MYNIIGRNSAASSRARRYLFALGRGCGHLALACLLVTPAFAAAPTAKRVAGSKPGLWYWTLPTTPNKLKPLQSWSGAAAAPNGDIYVAGMNHIDNAALYRLTPKGGSASKPGQTLTYVGDAKSASQAARNWQAGEPIEKFHTQPVWQGTKIYVANLDYSFLDTGYLTRRGFHWYGYDWKNNGFRDLSATEPGGVGAPHGGLLSLVVDRNRNRIYGASSPTGDLMPTTSRRDAPPCWADRLRSTLRLCRAGAMVEQHGPCLFHRRQQQ